jgi:hypothetical protein
LDKDIWALADQRLKLDQQIAIKRRTKSREIAASLEDLFQKQEAVDGHEVTNGFEDDEMDLDDRMLPPSSRALLIRLEC